MTLRIGMVLHGPGRQPTGVPRASLELLRALLDLPDGPDVVALGDEDLAGVEQHPRLHRVPLPPAVRRTAAVISRTAGIRAAHLTCVAAWLPAAARAHDLDVVHDLTGLAALAGSFGRTRTVATVHDLVSLRAESTNDFVDDAVQRRWLPRVLPRVDAVVTVSRTVADEVRQHMPLDGVPVVPVYHGIDHRLQLRAPAEGTPPPDHPFLLAVGATSERKNHQAVVRAARAGWLSGDLPPLVVVGPRGPVVERLLATARRLGVERCVLPVGYQPDHVLRSYYERAEALVYPSLDEGFGLPILEAMAAGLPVLTAAQGATEEIAGGAALLVDPRSDASIGDGLRRITGDAALRAELAQRGVVRAAEFTWRRSAEDLADVYARAVQACA